MGHNPSLHQPPLLSWCTQSHIWVKLDVNKFFISDDKQGISLISPLQGDKTLRCWAPGVKHSVQRTVHLWDQTGCRLQGIEHRGYLMFTRKILEKHLMFTFLHFSESSHCYSTRSVRKFRIFWSFSVNTNFCCLTWTTQDFTPNNDVVWETKKP